MMTDKEKEKGIESVKRFKMAMFHKWLDRTPEKLHAFNTWFEPPEEIRKAVCVRAEKLASESREACTMYEKLEKVEEKLYALPSISEYSLYGKRYTLAHSGQLPDGSTTSKDEAEGVEDVGRVLHGEGENGMRQKKFRGRDTVTGKYVYGKYSPFLGDESMPMIETQTGLVEVDNVAQLIGFDKNGHEVYGQSYERRISNESVCKLR